MNLLAYLLGGCLIMFGLGSLLGALIERVVVPEPESPKASAIEDAITEASIMLSLREWRDKERR